MTDLWKSLGLTKDDTILIQGNITGLLMKYKTTPEMILESLLSTCGTVVFPCFMKDYQEWKDNGFDIRSTPSRMGVLSETARCHKDSVRSSHPLFGFVSIGKHSSMFNCDNDSGYGADSPFGVLRKLNGKVMVINLPNSRGCSILHHAEELELVPYRKYRTFSGKYTDKNGETTERTYSFYGNGGYKTLLNPLDTILWERQLYTGCKPNEGHGCRIIDANTICEVVSEVIRDGKAKGILYED